MGTWSISPQVEGVSIDTNGKLTYPPNLTETTFTVKYDDGKGCSGEYVYRVPESCGDVPPPEPEICDWFIVDSGNEVVEKDETTLCDSAWIAAEGKPIFNINGVTSETCNWIEVKQYKWGIDPDQTMCSLYNAYPTVAQHLMVLAGIEGAASTPISTDGCEWSTFSNLCIQPPPNDPDLADKGIIRACNDPTNPGHAQADCPGISVYPDVVQKAIRNEGDYANKLGAVKYTVKENKSGKKRECIIEWYVNDVKCKSKAFKITQKG